MKKVISLMFVVGLLTLMPLCLLAQTDTSEEKVSVESKQVEELTAQEAIELAKSYDDAGQKYKALELRKKYMEVNADDRETCAQFSYEIAMFYKKKAMLENSIVLFDETVKNYPENVEWASHALWQAGECHMYIHHSETAQAYFARIMNEYPKSDHYEMAARMYGDALIQSWELDKAIKHYETYIDLSSRSDYFNSYSMTMIGLAYIYKREYDKGFKKLDDCIKTFPKNAGEAIYWKIYGLSSKGEREEALKYAESMKDKDPAFVAMGIGDIYSMSGDHKKAEESYRKCSEITEKLPFHPFKAECLNHLFYEQTLNKAPEKEIAVTVYKLYKISPVDFRRFLGLTKEQADQYIKIVEDWEAEQKAKK